ncbi:Lcp65Ac [Carabus blaptoides fortunei]
MCWLRFVLLMSLAMEFAVSFPTDKPSPELNVHYEIVPETGNTAYYFVYEHDGILRMERGEVKLSKDNKMVLVVTGTYSYIDKEGNLHTTKYTDENGIRKEEAEVPTQENEPVNKIDSALIGTSRSESSDDTRRQETGKVEKKSDGTDCKITEGSTSYIGVNEVINTDKCVAAKQIVLSYGTLAVLRKETIFQDDIVQSQDDPTLLSSLTGISENDSVPEVVEESIVKVDEPQMNMCKAMDGSLLGRIMY